MEIPKEDPKALEPFGIVDANGSPDGIEVFPNNPDNIVISANKFSPSKNWDVELFWLLDER